MYNVGLRSADDSVIFFGAKYGYADGFFNTVALAVHAASGILDVALANAIAASILINHDATHMRTNSPIDNEHKVPIVDFTRDRVFVRNATGAPVFDLSCGDFVKRYKR